jgi:Family of unknown function (DUF5681)
MIDDDDAADETDSRRPANPQQQVGYEVGYGRPPRHHQFRKGTTGNPKGRPRGSGKQKIRLYDILMDPVWITIDGRRKKVPFPVAHLQRLKEQAAKGNPKASQSLLQLYRDMRLFDSEESDEPVTFTLNISRPGAPPLGKNGTPTGDDGMEAPEDS